MTDESKPNIEPLELNRETLQDLTENEAEGVEGGMRTAGEDQSMPATRCVCLPPPTMLCLR